MFGEPSLAFATPFFCIEKLEQTEPGVEPYYRVTGPDSAIVLVINHEAKVLMVRQFRPTLGVTTIEFPAGAIESGERPVDAAQREVREESGYRCKLFQLGDYFHLMMNRTGIKDYLFCGIAEEQVPASAEEGTQHEWISREAFHEAINDGSYRQLAGLGILHLASAQLGIDFMTTPAATLVDLVREELSNDFAVGE